MYRLARNYFTHVTYFCNITIKQTNFLNEIFIWINEVVFGVSYNIDPFSTKWRIGSIAQNIKHKPPNYITQNPQ